MFYIEYIHTKYIACLDVFEINFYFVPIFSLIKLLPTLLFNKYEILIDALMQRLKDKDIDILESLDILESPVIIDIIKKMDIFVFQISLISLIFLISCISFTLHLFLISSISNIPFDILDIHYIFNPSTHLKKVPSSKKSQPR